MEGNIASGKSTLLEQLREGDYAQIVEEPVAKWQNLMPGADGNLIGRMYVFAFRPCWLAVCLQRGLLPPRSIHCRPPLHLQLLPPVPFPLVITDGVSWPVFGLTHAAALVYVGVHHAYNRDCVFPPSPHRRPNCLLQV